MGKKVKISLGTAAFIIQKCVYNKGHWGNHGNKDNGWIGYVIVLGIMIVSFLFLLFFT